MLVVPNGFDIATLSAKRPNDGHACCRTAGSVVQRPKLVQEAVPVRGEPLDAVAKPCAFLAEGVGAVQQSLNIRTRSVLHVPSRPGFGEGTAG